MGCAGLGILLALVSAGAEGFDPFAVATPVTSYEFGPDQDRNYDRLPDGWTRRGGPGFPIYTKAELDTRGGHGAPGSLRLTPDGAPAAVYGLAAAIDDGHLLLFEGWIRTRRLRGDAAVCSVSVLDTKMQRLARHLAVPVSGTHRDWVRVRVGPIRPVPGQRFAVVGCHLVEAGEADLSGGAWFDDLRLSRMPLLTLDGRDSRFRRPAEPTTITVAASGLEPGSPYRLSVILKEESGAEVDRFDRELAAVPDDGAGVRPVTTEWSVPGARYGYYRLNAELRRDGSVVGRQETALAVVDPTPPLEESPFGWCVTEIPSGMGPDEFAVAAAEACVGRVKMPLWRDSADPVAGDRTSDFVERLAERDVKTIGLLDPPPGGLRRKFAEKWSGTAEIYGLRPTTWGPALDDVFARHGARVREWQLGRDGDESFAGMADLGAAWPEIRRQFDRLGRDTQIVVPWPAGRSLPAAVANRIFSVRQEDPMGLDGLDQQPSVAWVTVPGPEDQDIEGRAAELVRRVVLARAAGAATVFASDVVDPERGLLRPDGAPTELFLPWRTTVVCLGKSKGIGPISLPHGSHNRAFAGRAGATIAIWNDEATVESLTPGGAPVLVDVRGRSTPVTTDPVTGQCEVAVGPSPVFLTGASAELLRWQMTAGFDRTSLQSQHGPQSLAIVGTNSFSQGVGGSVTLTVPRGWQVERSTWPLHLAAGEEFRLPVPVTLPADASLGGHHAELEFDIQADRPYRFTLRKELTVGLGDIDIEVKENRLPDGRLEVVQTLVNRTSPAEVLNFRCDLFVPGAQRLRQYVIELGAGRDVRRYYLPDADGLKGKELWLRAEQENGRRVLNYRWTVGKDE